MTERDHITDEERETCLRVLQTLVANPELCLRPGSDFREIQNACAMLSRSLKRQMKVESQARDRDSVEQTGLRQTRRQRRDTQAVTAIPDARTEAGRAVRLATARHCYICKQTTEYTHHFYDCMCPGCGDLNLSKRNQSADLQGHTALVTGGRVKIGFQIGLKLLRAGARLLVTTRFPVDAASRYSREDDFAEWQDRLQIYGVDFRHLPGLEQLTDQIAGQFSSLEILINNSAQTIRRPPAFYEHVWKAEQAALRDLNPAARALLGNLDCFEESRAALVSVSSSAVAGLPQLAGQAGHIATALSQVPLLPDDVQRGDFPVGELDEHGQQVDLRGHNSWVARVPDVSFVELLEVHAVNTFAPFHILQKLEPLLMARASVDRFVVNVSAMEGRFDHFKDGRHPHTNMAKAALNMLTRSCAEDYAKRRLFMNSVDTGWVTNEFPHAKVSSMQGEGFEPPLDEIDGAARVVAPVFDAANGSEPVFGRFLKDYRSITW